jgi:hypothetical protein
MQVFRLNSLWFYLITTNPTEEITTIRLKDVVTSLICIHKSFVVKRYPILKGYLLRHLILSNRSTQRYAMIITS